MSQVSHNQNRKSEEEQNDELFEEQKKKDIARVADTNVELLGSKKDRAVKKAAAETEEAWKNAGKKPGLEIWRINKFKVDSVNVCDYGKFFDGDSYIVLNTYTKDGAETLLYDLHFWIGKDSTQDEYGTAAYKTVELDTYLDDKPVQHREVQGFESKGFKSYFPNGEFTILKGGYDSAFNKVEEIVYGSKMFKIKGSKNSNGFSLVQVDMKWSKIYADSVLLIVTNETIYQLNGPNASHRYKYGMKQRVNTLEIVKFKPQIKVITEEFSCYDDITECLTRENCKALFGSETAPEDLVFGDKKEDKTETEPTGIVLYRAIRKKSDDANELEFEEIARGDDVLNMEENQFEDNYLYLLDLDGMVILLDKRKVRTEGAMVVGQRHLDQKPTKAQKRAGMCCEKNGQRFLNHAKSK